MKENIVFTPEMEGIMDRFRGSMTRQSFLELVLRMIDSGKVGASPILTTEELQGRTSPAEVLALLKAREDRPRMINPPQD